MASYGPTAATMRARGANAAGNGGAADSYGSTLPGSPDPTSSSNASSDEPYTASSVTSTASFAGAVTNGKLSSSAGSATTTTAAAPPLASIYPRGSSLSHAAPAATFGGRGLAAMGANKGKQAVGGYRISEQLSNAEKRLLLGVVLLACCVRLWKLGQPSSVVFDEVHFGGFASKYMKQRFFMDVHPPLAKLLIALVAWAAGFHGDFDFKDIGREYLVGEHTPVPYVAMRSLGAVLGIVTIPLGYLTLRSLGLRTMSALVAALLLTFDNALVTQSRLILLDSPLVFFTALTTYCWVNFANEDRRCAFTRHWWGWLMLTGASLGAVVSCKWVGLFTIATIGTFVVLQLWLHLGDTRQPLSRLIRHFVARALCLIVLPVTFYMATFAIHLGVLTGSGDGDAFMSSTFQHTLRGHGMPDTYADVALGSTVTIRHLNTQGGYLHSHPHNYPGGSGQQQITLYPHSDENNEWYVIAAPGPDDPPAPTDENGVPLAVDGPHDVERYFREPLTWLKHGAEIRLMHRKTDKRLHSHEGHRPPITEADYQNEVTGYGFPGFTGDANDNFFVEIESGHAGDAESSKRVRALRTTFRLRHALTGCYLFSHKVSLPDWGFGQQEVTCNKNPTRPNSLWYVETNAHPLLGGDVPPPIPAAAAEVAGSLPEPPVTPLKDAEMVNYLNPGFFSKFWELQKVMWATNAGLTERHAYDSRPKTWPVLRRGINFWTKDHRQVYLIGNPFVWWGSTVAVLVFAGARALLMLRAKRGFNDFHDSFVVYYDATCGLLFLGWFMHFFPFFLMKRQLFLHHYLPALYFGVLLFGAVFDMATSLLKPRQRLQVAAIVVALALLAFSTYAPLSYAGRWTVKGCERARLLKTWDFQCRDFPADLSAYSEFGPGIHTVDHPVLRANASSGLSQGTVLGGSVHGVDGAAVAVDVPQAGQHAFEKQPPQAAQSGGAGAAGDKPPAHRVEAVAEDPLVAQLDRGSGGGGGHDAAAADKVVKGWSGAKDHAGAAAQDAARPEGLDQGAMEDVLLEGTAAAGVGDAKKAGKRVDAQTEPTGVAAR